MWVAPDGAGVVKRVYRDEQNRRVTEWPAVCNCAGLPNEANARLIAAAPDLHRALSDLLELVRVHGLEPCNDLPMHEFEAIVDGVVQDAGRALNRVMSK
jgi:hypothetical protein